MSPYEITLSETFYCFLWSPINQTSRELHYTNNKCRIFFCFPDLIISIHLILFCLHRNLKVCLFSYKRTAFEISEDLSHSRYAWLWNTTAAIINKHKSCNKYRHPITDSNPCSVQTFISCGYTVSNTVETFILNVLLTANKSLGLAENTAQWYRTLTQN